MTKTDLQRYLRCEAMEYLEKTSVTPEERQDVLEWVKAGSSVYENPWCMANENGHPMDYITAQREARELAELQMGS